MKMKKKKFNQQTTSFISSIRIYTNLANKSVATFKMCAHCTEGGGSGKFHFSMLI